MCVYACVVKDIYKQANRVKQNWLTYFSLIYIYIYIYIYTHTHTHTHTPLTKKYLIKFFLSPLDYIFSLVFTAYAPVPLCIKKKINRCKITDWQVKLSKKILRLLKFKEWILNSSLIGEKREKSWS